MSMGVRDRARSVGMPDNAIESTLPRMEKLMMSLERHLLETRNQFARARPVWCSERMSPSTSARECSESCCGTSRATRWWSVTVDPRRLVAARP